MQIRFRKCREYGLRSTEVYEWSPDGKRWYPIHRDNIRFTIIRRNSDQVRSIFNAALQGEILLNATYEHHHDYKCLWIEGIVSPGAGPLDQPVAKIKRAYEQLTKEGFFVES